LAGIFMQHNLEQFEAVRETLLSSRRPAAPSVLRPATIGPWS
jgi:hypothetical protein